MWTRRRHDLVHLTAGRRPLRLLQIIALTRTRAPAHGLRRTIHTLKILRIVLRPMYVHMTENGATAKGTTLTIGTLARDVTGNDHLRESMSETDSMHHLRLAGRHVKSASVGCPRPTRRPQMRLLLLVRSRLARWAHACLMDTTRLKTVATLEISNARGTLPPSRTLHSRACGHAARVRCGDREQ